MADPGSESKGPNMTTCTVWFIVACTVIILVEAACCKLWRKSREKKAGDGFLVLHDWPSWLRVTVVGLIVSVGWLPSLLFFTALLLGGALGGIEGWSFEEGYEYAVCNMVGIGPLVDLTPDTTLGYIADIIISCWALVLASTILGLAAGLNVTLKWLSNISPTKWGFLRAILLHVPLLIGVIGLLTGAILSALEEWPLVDGLLFMIGTLCGIQDPLTAVEPENATGNFFVGVCFTIELLIGGAVIGAVGAHPSVIHFLEHVQGKDLPVEDGIKATDATTAS